MAVRHPPAFFDADSLRQELTALWRARKPEGAAAQRRAVLARLKALLSAGRETARARLMADGDGRHCAESLSDFQDELIRLIYDYTTAHVFRADNPSDAEHMAIVATGGYGRGLLAPWSDIDLLFLLPYKQTPWGESVVEYALMLLWDLGLKVGHATRTVDQCLKLAEADMTIRTSVLDARLIHGHHGLYEELMVRLSKEATASAVRAFLDAKMAERDARHTRAGQSRYRVEPNIKDGKGGLRDLHTLHWMTSYLAASAASALPKGSALLTPAEVATFRRCENFLWTVRCHLHFLRGRADERLTFDAQPELARMLGYKARLGLRAVERFMKHYFLIAKEVGDLTTVLCAVLEMRQLMSGPSLGAFLAPLTWRMRRRLAKRTDFRIENGRITVADADVFERDPVNIIRFFAHAERNKAFFHPEALRLLGSSLVRIDDTLRNSPEANRIFLEMVTSHANPETTLRRMNEAGVLGRFIPEFGRVVSMMQFNMYHHFTVDEHLLRTVGELHAIEAGEVADTLPLSTGIIKGIQNRRALFLAAFLHDIAKGRREDHSIAGAKVARRLCPRLGMTAGETETVAWLIEQHLVMSTIAQSRDLGDPKTIHDFAKIVQTPERLKLLLLLTVADIRAVGPGTWNGWKGQLLRTLYYETEPLIAGGLTKTGGHERIKAAQQALSAALADWSAADVARYVARHYPDYWLRTETRKQAEHARLLRTAEAEGRSFATAVVTDAFTAVTELTVLAPNHPRLLALFAGACAAAGANIVGAHIATTRDGLALDTFLLRRELEDDADEARRAGRIGQTIGRLLDGSQRLSELMARRRPAPARARAFTVEPEVIVDNALSDELSVIEVAGLDRPGLLYELTSAISDLSLDIRSAHITTFGEKAIDVLYVTDLTGKKITSEARQAAVRERLVKVLAGERPEEEREAAAAPPVQAQ